MTRQGTRQGVTMSELERTPRNRIEVALRTTQLPHNLRPNHAGAKRNPPGCSLALDRWICGEHPSGAHIVEQTRQATHPQGESPVPEITGALDSPRDLFGIWRLQLGVPRQNRLRSPLLHQAFHGGGYRTRFGPAGFGSAETPHGALRRSQPEQVDTGRRHRTRSS